MKKDSSQLQNENAGLREENRKLKKSLQQSQDSFFKIFHASSNPITINSQKEGRIVDLNEAFARIGGFRREELIGRTSTELGLWADPTRRDFFLKELNENGRVHNFEVEVLTKTNESRKLLLSADPIEMGTEPCLLVSAVDLTEVMRRGEILRESEKKYRTLVENSLQGVAIIQDGDLVFCNQTHADFFGHTVEELMALPDAILLVHPDDRDMVLDRYQDLVSGKPGPQHYVHRFIRKDGAERWLEIYASLIEFKGKPAAQVVSMDVTEREKAEKELRESEAQFRLVAETIDEIVWVFDPEKEKPIYVSPAYDRIYGYSREHILEEGSFFDPIHPEDRQKTIASIQKGKSGQKIDMEFRIVRPDGSIRYIWDRAFPIHDKDGRIKVIGISQDVTSWRRSEKSLKESMDYLHQIINCIGDPIFVKDYRHRLVLVNEAMSTFIGIPREELIGKTGFETLAEDYYAPLWEEEETVLSTGREHVTQDTLPDAEGKDRILMTKKALLTKESGEKQVVGVIRDVTEFKELETQFLQAQKMEAIGVLAGSVAHDFNNLLTVIQGYIDLMKQECDEGDPRYYDLEQVQRATEHAVALTSQLLAFSRKQVVHQEILNLNAVLSDMDSMIRRLIREDIQLTLNLQQDLGKIKADPAQIQQIVMNLVVNARDAMPEGGTLHIETANEDFAEGYVAKHPGSKPGAYVMLSIGDDGIGMDKATHSRIFEPFFTTKEKGKGTGLGLSTVYGIIKQSGGFIQVHSEYKKGTTFKIYFPRIEGAGIEYMDVRGLDQKKLGDETIVVVEDDAPLRILTGRILRKYGYKVMEAGNGKEALNLVQSYPGEIHLVVTDMVMPGMDGKELISKLGVIRPGIKTLLISGYLENTVIQEGVPDGSISFSFLQKPFTAEDLVRNVQDAIGPR